MISYAQNLEDVVLNRIFKNKPAGFYIDVGAHDPTELSVTKHFYDLGWSGINIEPISTSYRKFRHQRPRDINLNCAAGANHGTLTIHEVEGYPALSSFNHDAAVAGGKIADSSVKDFTVEIQTLAEICGRHCDGMIDFIKIDVEGYEKEVILGADWKKFRPVMLVAEACKPLEPLIPTWQEWEPLVLGADYILVYYDGLNRYYLHREDEHLKKEFDMPMTPALDNFSLYSDVRKAREAENRADISDSENSMLHHEKEESNKKIQQLENEISDYEEQVFELTDEISGLYGQINELNSGKK